MTLQDQHFPTHRAQAGELRSGMDTATVDDPARWLARIKADAALQQLARIVRGADTSRLDLTPQSSGLYAISLGLSQVYADDHEMLEHGLVMYDALYAWCQRCQAETHKWPPKMPA